METGSNPEDQTPDTELTLTIPGPLMNLLRTTAAREFRDPAGQALTLIRDGLIRSRKRPDPAARLAALAPVLTALRELHTGAGSPSARAIAERAWDEASFSVSHTTVHAALAGLYPPSWNTVEAITRALGGDVPAILALWAAANSPPQP